MSILSIIEVNEYKTRFPDTALNNIRDARVQSALNLSFSYLDVKCGCAISSRWNIESPTKGYLTPEQKDYVKEAMYVETQYILANNLDFSQGADQTSFGSLSTSSSRPERKEICESALMYLQKAGLYDYLSFSTPTYAGSGRFSTTQCGEIDPTDVPISETTADLRYVHKAQGVDQAGKFLWIDSNGNVALTNAGLDPDNYYNYTEIDSKLLPLQQMRDKLALGYLAHISRDVLNKTITITDDVGTITTFPYGGGGGGGIWGAISGDIQLQNDLQTEFGTKQNKVYYGPTAPTSPQDNDIWVQQSMGPTFEQIQSDWNQTDNTQVDYIKNKPSVVTIDTSQTIDGVKIFKDKILVKDLPDERWISQYGSGGIQYTENNATYQLEFPSKSGTFAMLSDIPSSANHLYQHTIRFKFNYDLTDTIIRQGIVSILSTSNTQISTKENFRNAINNNLFMANGIFNNGTEVTNISGIMWYNDLYYFAYNFDISAPSVLPIDEYFLDDIKQIF